MIISIWLNSSLNTHIYCITFALVDTTQRISVYSTLKCVLHRERDAFHTPDFSIEFQSMIDDKDANNICFKLSARKSNNSILPEIQIESRE